MKNYVISDIHGCSSTFSALLSRIGLNKHDRLYLLGDYIDRGPDSSGVLDTIIELKNKKYNLFPIKGNHEEHLLKAEQEYDLPTFIHFVKKINKSGDLLNNDGYIKTKYRNLLIGLPYYYLLEDFVLVHAGLNLSIPNPFDDISALIDLRDFEYITEHPAIENRKVIHGHVPCELNEINVSIKKCHRVINIDNGCVYTNNHKIYNSENLGNLLCLELNSFELKQQKNIE